MRISILIEHFGPRGGSEEYARVVGSGLLERGHEVRFLYQHDSPTDGELWTSFVDMVDAKRLPSHPVARSAWLVRHAQTIRPDAIFVQNVALGADTVTALMEAAPVVRFVHDFRPVCLRVSRVLPVSRRNCSRPLGYGCLPHGCSIGPKRRAGLPLSWNSLTERLDERDACRRMNRVLVASGFMRELLLLNGFDAERVTTVGLFCPLLVPAIPPPGVSPERLLYLGQLQRFKGLPVLLDAMRQLPPSATLEVAGEGPWRTRCEEMARTWGLSTRVRFLGRVEREQLPALLARSGALVFPSTWNEPFGLAGLEAMAFGRPVVGFAVGGVSDWLDDGQTGLLVRQVTGAALATAIRALIADPEQAAAMGVHGHRRVLERFTLAGHLDRLETEIGLAGAQQRGAASQRSA